MSSVDPVVGIDLKGPLSLVEQLCVDHQSQIEPWFEAQWQKTQPPFYASVDLRNAGFKLAPVDTNLFPAGFNNLSEGSNDLCVQAIRQFMRQALPEVKTLLLVPESHTRNLFYLESVGRLVDLLQQAGLRLRVAMILPSDTRSFEHQCMNGFSFLVEPLLREQDQLGVKGFVPDAVILNNDFSAGVPDCLRGLRQQVIPPIRFSWAHRLKSEHFAYYQQVAQEFGRIAEIDPWLLMPEFERCPEVDFMLSAGSQCLYDHAVKLLSRIEKKYNEYNIKESPFLVVKADQGTYGMAVMMIHDAEELRQLNRKQRTRMSTLKGGRQVTRAIIQEGVHTIEKAEGQFSAESALYAIGGNVVGGFYRLHESKRNDENLNSPGMKFIPLSVSSAGLQQGHLYAYSVVSRLAVLAAARELAEFKG